MTGANNLTANDISNTVTVNNNNIHAMGMGGAGQSQHDVT